jgi:hypothetical protein
MITKEELKKMSKTEAIRFIIPRLVNAPIGATLLIDKLCNKMGVSDRAELFKRLYVLGKDIDYADKLQALIYELCERFLDKIWED